MKGEGIKTGHLVLGLFASVFTSIIVWNSPYLTRESSFMLVIFNFLFVSLVFPLDGALLTKLLMLMMGNIVGWSWNSASDFLANTLAESMGRFFTAIYVILSPLMNLMWIVPFWSVSLTVVMGKRIGGKG